MDLCVFWLSVLEKAFLGLMIYGKHSSSFLSQTLREILIYKYFSSMCCKDKIFKAIFSPLWLHPLFRIKLLFQATQKKAVISVQ